LRNRRLSGNITLEEVSGSTGITTAILQTLEDEDREELLAEVYINAFYKKYAQYLEADSEEIKVKYQHEATSMKRPGSASGFSTVITIKGQEGTFLAETLHRLLLPVIVAASGVLIFWVYKNYLAPYNHLGFFQGYCPVLFAYFPDYFPNFLC
jgi:cytoskeletal protein RodZ